VQRTGIVALTGKNPVIPTRLRIDTANSLRTVCPLSDKKRILVLSVSAGSGHVRAAEGIAAYAKDNFSDLSVRHRDLMQLVPTYFRKIYTDLYLKLAAGLPEAWGWLYRKTDHEPTGSVTERCRRMLQRISTKKLFQEITAYEPDAIVCTHFLPAELLATAVLENRIHCPVWVTVTDFDLHQMWVHEGITGYFVANEELAFRLESSGVDPATIVVTGIPVMPEFVNHTDRREYAAKYGLNPSHKTLLIMGGGAGLGISCKLVKLLFSLQSHLQIIVMAGKNQSLLARLQNLSLFFPGQLVVVGFTDKVPELMACADLVITKPGGLSTSECLVMGIPMLLINPIPGQEERNASYLLQEGVAQRADDAATLIYRLRLLLANPEKLSHMKTQAQRLGKPNAAANLLHHVINNLVSGRT
jgi:processive 1,2-diacylglycerol beta-glucosyltransferase